MSDVEKVTLTPDEMPCKDRTEKAVCLTILAMSLIFGVIIFVAVNTTWSDALAKGQDIGYAKGKEQAENIDKFWRKELVNTEAWWQEELLLKSEEWRIYAEEQWQEGYTMGLTVAAQEKQTTPITPIEP